MPEYIRKKNYTGHELDSETGLLYAGARYYMPAIGRWTSVEPLLNELPPNKLLRIRGRQLLATSPYNYTFNNPINLSDPDGKCPDCVFDVITVGLSAKDFFDNPNWGKAGWLLADVAGAALPFVPSTGSFRHGGKLLTQGERITDAGRMLSARRAIGMSADAASTAVENVGRVDHASRHLIDADIMKGVTKGSKEARNMFKQIATNILEQPSATFNHTLRGGLEAKGFLGTVDGEQVVIFVAKQGKGKVRQGDVATAVKPMQRQLDEWLNQ